MELIPGKQYLIRLTNGAWVTGLFNSEDRIAGYNRYAYGLSNLSAVSTSRRKTHYSFTNVATGRHVTIKSKRRIKEVSVQ